MRRFAGKIIGTILGLLAAGPAGAFLGLIIGHLHDLRKQMPRPSHTLREDFFPDFSMSQNQKSIFALSVIVLGAKLAKIDGHVSREEVLAFRRVFRTPQTQLAQVGEIFDHARRSSEDYEPYAARLAGAFAHMPDILEEVLAGLFYIAIADSPHLSHSEISFLHRVASIFGFGETDFRRIASRVGIYMTSKPPPESESNKPKDRGAYHLLGLPPDASKKDIKKTYHALIRKHHPDILHAQGASETTIKAATERMQKINHAYTQICKEKGMK
ncbi:MAG: TerB family tellurite resistance protein [Bdellovibrionales bacterium]